MLTGITMGCPYIVNQEETVMTRKGPRQVTTGGKTVCPTCDGSNISTNDKRAPNGCVCQSCGHILCAIPKC